MLSYFKFHHIGIATGNIKNTAQYYLDADYVKSETVFDPVQNVSIAFLTKIGMPKIELIEPSQSTSPGFKIIQKSGVTPYHICYEVDNIETAINDLKKKRFMLLTKPVIAVALNNKKICFLYNKDVGLIELVE